MRDKHPHLHVAADAEPAADAEEPAAMTDEPPEQPPPSDEPVILRRARGSHDGEYQATAEGIRLVREGHELPLSNFDAVITSRVRAGTSTRLTVRVTMGDHVRELQLTAAKLESLRWVAESLPGAVIWPGPAVRHHLLTAITLLSRGEQVEIAAHDRLGWTRGEDGRWGFVHAGGMVAADGHHDVLVEIGAPLDRFVLPVPPPADAARDAVRRLIGLLDVGPDRATIPLLAATLLPTASRSTCALMIVGETGTGKSALASLFQSAFGPSMAHGPGLPTSWSSTRNAIEELGHLAADTMMVIDDFVPGTGQGNEADLDFAIRGMSQGQGRARLGRPARAIRCLPVVTAEQRPRLASLLARLVVINLGRGDLDWSRVTIAQQFGASGIYAAAVAAWISWLAPRLDEARARHCNLTDQLRRRFSTTGLHARSPDQLGQLGAVLLLLADFARQLGVLDDDSARAFVHRCDRALGEVRDQQLVVQQGNDPVRLFLHTLRSLIESGTVRIARDIRDDGSGDAPRIVGWARGDEVLVDPDAAIDAVQDTLHGAGHRLDIPETTLARAMRDADVLTAVDARGGKVRYTRRVTVAGARRLVWILRADALGLGEASR